MSLQSAIDFLNSNTQFKDDKAIDKFYKSKSYQSTLEEERKRKQQLIDQGLQQGLSWEEISASTGVDQATVQARSQKLNPNYGVQQGGGIPNPSTALRDWATRGKQTDQANANLDQATQEVIKLINDPKIPAKRKTALMKYLASQGIENPQIAKQNTQEITAMADPMNIPKAIGSSFETVATGVSRALPGGTADIEAARKGNEQASVTQEQIIRVLKDPNVPKERKDALLGLLNEENRQTAQQAAGLTKQVESETNKRKFAAAALDVGLTPFAMSPTGLVKGGTGLLAKGGTQLVGKGRLGADIVEGVAYTGLGAAQADEMTAKDLAINAGTNLIPLAAGQLGRRLSDWRAEKKTFQEAIATEPSLEGRITDPSRLLPDGSQSKAMRIAEIDAELENIRTGDTPSTTFKDTLPSGNGTTPTATTTPKTTQAGTPDMRTQAAKRQGTVTPSEQKSVSTTGKDVRALVKEREKLMAEIDAIENPQAKLAEEINLNEADLAKAQKSGDVKAVKQQEKTQTFLNQEADKLDTINESQAALNPSYSGAGSAPSAAKKTEALAIEKKLTDGFEIGETPTMPLKEQAEVGEALYRENKDAAIRVAMGLENAPGNVQASTMYKVVEHMAAKEGDAELLRKLATESTVPGVGKAYGQYNAAFAYRDPESPLTLMNDIVSARAKYSKAGIGEITKQEAQQITDMAGIVQKAKDNLLLNPSKDARSAYGKALVAMNNRKDELVALANPKFRDAVKTKNFYKRVGSKAIGLPKSLKATLDNSALFRQGWKVMATNPKVWAKNSLKSFEDIVRTVGQRPVMDEVHADIVSRDNMLNGMYKKAKLDVYGATKEFQEEAFPTTFKNLGKTKAGKIAGTPFKASEVAYDAFLQRNRADMFDYFLDDFVKKGGNINSKKDLQAIGEMVNALTGRGKTPRSLLQAGEVLNKMFFSPRLLFSNIDTLARLPITGGGSSYVRKRAQRNIAQIAATSATSLYVLSVLTGGKVETDPRSSDFGKLRIGDTRFDLSGGMAQLPVLGARMLTQSTKSSTTGNVNKLNTGEYGSKTTLDVGIDFLGNKLSPTFGVIRDFARGEDFSGKKPTVKSTIENLTVPLIISQYKEIKEARNPANIWAAMVSEGLGVGTNTYGLDSDWNANNSKQINGFKGEVSKQTFERANDQFNDEFVDWYNTVSSNDKFWKLSVDDRKQLVTNKKNQLTKDVLGRFNYKYQTERTPDDVQKLIDSLKDL